MLCYIVRKIDIVELSFVQLEEKKMKMIKNYLVRVFKCIEYCIDNDIKYNWHYSGTLIIIQFDFRY